MKGWMLAAGVVFTALAPASGPWRLHKSWHAPYEIQMPTPVVEEVAYVKQNEEEFPVWSAEAEEGSRSYSVRTFTITDAWRSGRVDAQILEDLKQGSRTMTRIRLSSLNERPVQGFPAVRFRVEIPTTAFVHHLAVLTPDKLYHLIVVSPPKSGEEERAEEFFKTFRITQS